MQTTLVTAATIIAGSVVAFMAGIGFVDVSTKVVGIPEPRSLTFHELSYSDGLISQAVDADGSDSIRAHWTARIIRNNIILCSGAGSDIYDGSRISYTPSEWTGADCPSLAYGDHGQITLEYTTEKNFVVSTTASFDVQ